MAVKGGEETILPLVDKVLSPEYSEDTHSFRVKANKNSSSHHEMAYGNGWDARGFADDEMSPAKQWP